MTLTSQKQSEPAGSSAPAAVISSEYGAWHHACMHISRNNTGYQHSISAPVDIASKQSKYHAGQIRPQIF